MQRSTGPRQIAPPVRSTFESLPLKLTRTADVSPSAVTFVVRKLLLSLGYSRNRTQEADGSIPFISTKIDFFFVRMRPLNMPIRESTRASSVPALWLRPWR